jgi:hypothetical protein
MQAQGLIFFKIIAHGSNFQTFPAGASGTACRGAGKPGGVFRGAAKGQIPKAEG